MLRHARIPARKVCVSAVVIWVCLASVAAAQTSPLAAGSPPSGVQVGHPIATWQEPPASQKPMLSAAIDREVTRILLAPSVSRGADLLAQQSESQNRGWIRRHSALFGALVGAGAGVVSAATMENELFCSGGDEDCLFHGGGRVLLGGGMGAGVGALAWWLVGQGAN